jgi:uncharacterized protein with PQ loop repeat
MPIIFANVIVSILAFVVLTIHLTKQRDKNYAV